jgi:hypothetical protein
MKNLSAAILLGMAVYSTASLATVLPKPEMALNFSTQKADGSFTDSSGKGHHANCFYLEPTLPACIPSFNAVRLDTDSFNWGWLEVPDSPLLNPDDEFSVAAWIIPQKLASLDGEVMPSKILGKVTADFNGGYLLGLEANPRNPYEYMLFAEAWDSAGKRFNIKKGAIAWNEASHVALTWKTNGTMRTYVNGKLVGSVTTGAKPIGHNSNPLRIGVAPWDTYAFAFDGYITKVEYFRRALSQAQILTLMKPKIVP